MKYRRIAVIYGSDSSEWEVACRSGEFVSSRIDENRYDVYEIFARFGKWQVVAFRSRNSMRVTFPDGSRPEIDKSDFSVRIYGEKISFDFVYIVQHGAPGENGLLQGYFEMLRIPHSGCSAFASAISFDKFASKCYVRESGIVKCAPDTFVREGENLDEFVRHTSERLQFPVFVKPTDGGSSFGITKVKRTEDLLPAVKFAFSEGSMVIAEQGITGRELTCAAYFDGTGVRALPPIEIITDHEYFDYDAKYNGHSSEICPAEIGEQQTAKVQEVTCALYRTLGCGGIVRIDYILAEDGLYFLEVNTIPGMTSASLVPKMVRTAGMDMTDFLTTVIENS